MQVIRELRGVRGIQGEPATSSTGRTMLQGREGCFRVIVFVRTRREKLIGGSGGNGLVED